MKPDMVGDMDHALLLQMGVSKAGHRIKILRAKDGTHESAPAPLVSTSSVIKPSETIHTGPKRKEHRVKYNSEPGNSEPMQRKGGRKPPLVTSSSPMTISKRSKEKNSSPRRGSPVLTEDEASISRKTEGVSTSSDSCEKEPDRITYYVRSLNSPHYLHPDSQMTIAEFTEHIVKQHHVNEPFAIFASTEEMKMVVVKEDHMMSPASTYFVIFNNEAYLIKRMEKDFKKLEETGFRHTESGKPIWTSENCPMKVDFVPKSELYISEGGMLGLCMAPGRTKKKKKHDWDRDLHLDLERIRNEYHCDVLVSLVRTTEMTEIQIPNLLEEVAYHGMLPYHYPIKDKWIPNSMEGLISSVEWIIEKLKEGLTVVCHCNGGKGRSGTLLVATLIGLGRKVHVAIDIVRKARAGTIRNPLQIAYVKRFKKAWKKSQRKEDEDKLPRKTRSEKFAAKDVKEAKELRDSKEIKVTSVPDTKEATKEQKESKEALKEPKETKDTKETKESKEPKESKETKESKEPKESKDTKEPKEPKESKDTKESKESKGAKGDCVEQQPGPLVSEESANSLLSQSK